MQEENSIDLLVLWRLFKNNIIYLGIAGVIMAFLLFIVSNFMIPKQYQSSSMLYVESTQIKNESVSTSDLYAAQELVSTCSVIFSKHSTFENVKAEIGDVKLYKDMVEIVDEGNTGVLSVVVTADTPEEAALIANTFAKVCVTEFETIIESGSIKIIDPAIVPSTHSSPNVVLFTFFGFVLGAVLAYVVFLMLELFNTRVKADDDLYKLYNIPVFSEIMDHQFKESVGEKNG